jgi:hypothetical protein
LFKFNLEMFICPYQYCERTFSRRAALREHTKSHKGQAYWETLNNISDNSHKNVSECEVKRMVYIFLIHYSFFIHQMHCTTIDVLL